MIVLFTLGLMIGWTSPYLARLTGEDSPIPLTEFEGSWVASSFNLGRFGGAIIGGTAVTYLGTKTTLTLIGPTLMLSWILIIVANSATWLYVSRVIGGISLGMCFSSYPLYLGEVSSPSNRGSMVTFAMTGFSLGTMTGNIIGAYISMPVFSYISLVPTVTFILLFLWLPHSPHHLVRMGDFEEAEKSILRLDPNANAKSEIESLKEFLKSSDAMTLRDKLREFNLPRNRKAGLIVVMLFFIMQFSGINSLVFYAEIVMTAAMVDIIPPATVVMIGGAVGVVSGWLSVYIADKLTRKVMMVASCVGVGTAMGVIAAHFALIHNGFDPHSLQWVLITAFLLFTFAVCNGLACVPNMILSEIFAPNIKSLAACIASIVLGLFSFAAAMSYQPLASSIGEEYVFLAHALFMVFAVIFASIFVPETKGKTLQEIQDSLVKS